MTQQHGIETDTASAIPYVTPQDVAQVTLSTTSATQLVASSPSVLAKQCVVVQAASTNAKSIYVGGPNVASTGTPRGLELQPGQSIPFQVQDPSTIYAAATVIGDKVNVGWT